MSSTWKRCVAIGLLYYLLLKKKLLKPFILYVISNCPYILIKGKRNYLEIPRVYSFRNLINLTSPSVALSLLDSTMYSNCQVVGIVSETMAASGNGRADLVPRAGSRCKFINWFRQGRRNYVSMHSCRTSNTPPGT